MVKAPVLDNKHPSAPSVFTAPALLREARRQKGIESAPVPSVCILDRTATWCGTCARAGPPSLGWPCYHTDLDVFDLAGLEVGIVGRAVGAAFAVLVAEELLASGCRLLIRLTWAGQITPAGAPPYFVVIDRALRDEGTSYHYAPPANFAEAGQDLVKAVAAGIERTGLRCVGGPSWTTDALFRETAQAIEAARAREILAVEMEAAALYAFAGARDAREPCAPAAAALLS